MDSNPVLILAHNCLELTKKCVASVLAQDIPTTVMIFDNGSTDETFKWAQNNLPKDSPIIHVPDNLGVSFGWNTGLRHLFANEKCNHVLSLNNDVILSKTCYNQLLFCNVPFVSGSETTDLADLDKEWPSLPLGGGPQFSAFLIRRDAWDKIGPFEERMVSWAGDCDYHIRAHRLGIPLQCSPVRYYHERSSTIKTAFPKERRQLELQADADREVFKEIYGCYPGDPVGYSALFR